MNETLIVTFTQKVSNFNENNFSILKMKVKYIKNNLSL